MMKKLLLTLLACAGRSQPTSLSPPHCSHRPAPVFADAAGNAIGAYYAIITKVP